MPDGKLQLNQLVSLVNQHRMCTLYEHVGDIFCRTSLPSLPPAHTGRTVTSRGAGHMAASIGKDYCIASTWVVWGLGKGGSEHACDECGAKMFVRYSSGLCPQCF